MNDNSNRTLRFNRSSGLQRRHFKRDCRPTVGEVVVFAVILLILLGVM